MPRPRRHAPTQADGRPLKITFGEMREMGLRGMQVYSHCGHYIALSASQWPDELWLPHLEPRLVCKGCGGRGADIGHDFAHGNPRFSGATELQ